MPATIFFSANYIEDIGRITEAIILDTSKVELRINTNKVKK